MVYINITNFVLISSLEKYHSMIEKHCLKNVVIFFQIKSYIWNNWKAVSTSEHIYNLNSTSNSKNFYDVKSISYIMLFYQREKFLRTKMPIETFFVCFTHLKSKWVLSFTSTLFYQVYSFHFILIEFNLLILFSYLSVLLWR